ncbi:MAG: hypothetical protein KAT65_26615 [Methanophagales archaeon]|nr:hypothetical protein [Methanophagales archaeon]
MELKEKALPLFTENPDKEFTFEELLVELEIDTKEKNKGRVAAISRHGGVLKKALRQLEKDGLIQQTRRGVYKKA